MYIYVIIICQNSFFNCRIFWQPLVVGLNPASSMMWKSARLTQRSEWGSYGYYYRAFIFVVLQLCFHISSLYFFSFVPAARLWCTISSKLYNHLTILLCTITSNICYSKYLFVTIFTRVKNITLPPQIQFHPWNIKLRTKLELDIYSIL